MDVRSAYDGKLHSVAPPRASRRTGHVGMEKTAATDIEWVAGVEGGRERAVAENAYVET